MGKWTKFVCMGLAGAAALASAACTPSAEAKNKAITARVIKDAGAQTAFVDASTADGAAIRHLASGMICAFPKDGAIQIEVFPANAQNSGAACTISADGAATTMLAVKFATPPTLDTAFSDSVSTNAKFAMAEVWKGKPSAADAQEPAGLPHFRIVRLQGEIDGNYSYLRLSMTEAGGWFVQQLVFASLDDAQRAEDAAGPQWRAILQNLKQAPPPAGPPAPPATPSAAPPATPAP